MGNIYLLHYKQGHLITYFRGKTLLKEDPNVYHLWKNKISEHEENKFQIAASG